jgi:hypothetical protein
MAAGALAIMSISAVSAAGGEMIGYISDTKCAMSGASKKTAAEWIQPAAFEKCVKECVGAGSEAVFVTEDNKIIKLAASSRDKITPFLGRKVSVAGKVAGGTLTVDTIKGLPIK